MVPLIKSKTLHSVLAVETAKEEADIMLPTQLNLPLLPGLPRLIQKWCV
jgi:hypothetical protein